MNEPETNANKEGVALRSLLPRYFLRFQKYPESGVLIAFVTLLGFFAIVAPKFYTLDQLTGIFTLVSELGIITIGVNLLMISGEFNLSVSAVYAFSAFLFATIANSTYSPLALVIVLGIAAFWGFLGGVITLRMRIPSFITTLGLMMVVRGLLLAVTRGVAVVYDGDTIVPTILGTIMGYGFRPSHFWFVGLVVIFSFILRNTPYGNWVYATGGSKEVTRAMGVNVNRVKLVNFTISGGLAGLSGCIVLSRFKIANPAYGFGLELEAIAAAVIGGSFLMGGYGTVIGAAIGSFLIGMIRIGLLLAGAPAYWYQTFVGAILIIAVIVNMKISRLEI